MVLACLILVLLGFAIAVPATALLRAGSNRIGAHDSRGVAGQVKVRRKIPNTGGIALFVSIALPLGAALIAVNFWPLSWFEANVPSWIAEHVPGMKLQSALGTTLLVCLTVLHILGLIDDRRPLGPWLKLIVMAVPALIVTMAPAAGGSETRLLSLLDSRVGGAWLSISVTVVWFLVVTNALNFMDNMDGLSAGVTAVAGGCLMATALLHGQWFVAGTLGLLVGACAGFLVFNFPWGWRDPLTGARKGASIFMGDGGSLVLGFLLAFLTVRMTYVDPSPSWREVLQRPDGGIASSEVHHQAAWHPLLIPLFILAVPLYDFASVVLIRLTQGKSPFVGDRQHMSHRMERRGLSARAIALLIYLFTAATGIMAIPLASMEAWQAALVAGQTVILLAALALFEWAEARRSNGVSP